MKQQLNQDQLVTFLRLGDASLALSKKKKLVRGLVVTIQDRIFSLLKLWLLGNPKAAAHVAVRPSVLVTVKC